MKTFYNIDWLGVASAWLNKADSVSAKVYNTRKISESCSLCPPPLLSSVGCHVVCHSGERERRKLVLDRHAESSAEEPSAQIERQTKVLNCRISRSSSKYCRPPAPKRWGLWGSSDPPSGVKVSWIDSLHSSSFSAERQSSSPDIYSSFTDHGIWGWHFCLSAQQQQRMGRQQCGRSCSAESFTCCLPEL
jgi:hypothetical protein